MEGEGFSVAFDPLDGSSIVDTNFTVRQCNHCASEHSRLLLTPPAAFELSISPDSASNVDTASQ